MQPFLLERYFAQYEFKAKYLFSPSDCESLSLGELLAMADPQSRLLWDELRLSYTESPGHPLLRQEIAELYHSINENQILVTVPEEGIFIAMQVLLQPGDHVLATMPAYQSLYEVARSLGCAVTPWFLQVVDGRWKLGLEFLEKNITSRTRLLVVNFPHNPTGYMPTHEEYQAILGVARKHHLALFSDEMYRWLEYDPQDQLPSAWLEYEGAVTLSGLSKSFALPGLRIGWLATQDKGLLQRLQSYKDYTTICQSAPSEILAIIALRNHPAILERNRNIVRSNLRTAAEFFQNSKNQIEWIPPKAGSIAFPKWKGNGRVEDFCQEALDRKGVMVVPGSMFEYPGNHFRVGLGRLNFPQACEALAELFEER